MAIDTERLSARRGSISEIRFDHLESEMGFYQGTPRDDVLIGSDASDEFLVWQGGIDQVVGLGGNDLINFGTTLTAEDRVDGGDGRDTVFISGDMKFVVDGEVFRQVESLVFEDGSVNLVIARSSTVSTIQIGGRSDTVSMVDASRTDIGVQFAAYEGRAEITGGTGDDIFHFYRDGKKAFRGGDGFDRIGFTSALAGVTVDLSSGSAQVDQTVLTFSSIEAVSGSRYADTLSGTRGSDWLNGNGGDDRLIGRGGDDVFTIGIAVAGIAATEAFVSGGAGFDTADFSSWDRATAGVTASLEKRGAQDSGQGVYSIRSVEGLSGTSFADVLTGDDRDNDLFGAQGSDELYGGAGNDQLFGDSQYASVANERELRVRPAVFTPADAAGNDLLQGGAGADVLTGGRGDDTFVYVRLNDSSARAHDMITDFEQGDRINVSRIDADAVRGGNQAFHLGRTAERVGDIIVTYDSGTDRTIVSLFVDADRRADAVIALSGNVTLTDANFVF